MTMNERLFACGLMSEFDSALRNRNRNAFVAVVTQLAFTREVAASYADIHFESLASNAAREDRA
jgi:hypothetical protein